MSGRPHKMMRHQEEDADEAYIADVIRSRTQPLGLDTSTLRGGSERRPKKVRTDEDVDDVVDRLNERMRGMDIVSSYAGLNLAPRTRVRDPDDRGSRMRMGSVSKTEAEEIRTQSLISKVDAGGDQKLNEDELRHFTNIADKGLLTKHQIATLVRMSKPGFENREDLLLRTKYVPSDNKEFRPRDLN